jgi:hypothetical protein
MDIRIFLYIGPLVTESEKPEEWHSKAVLVSAQASLSVMLSIMLATILLAFFNTPACQFMPLSRSPRRDIRWGWSARSNPEEGYLLEFGPEQ